MSRLPCLKREKITNKTEASRVAPNKHSQH